MIASIISHFPLYTNRFVCPHLSANDTDCYMALAVCATLNLVDVLLRLRATRIPFVAHERSKKVAFRSIGICLAHESPIEFDATHSIAVPCTQPPQ